MKKKMNEKTLFTLSKKKILIFFIIKLFFKK